MPAVAPAERHNPERYGSPNAIRPARLRAPPPAAEPCRGRPSCPPPLYTVEQAARLAMPAVTPAEPHNPKLCGSSHAIRPARLRAPPQPAAARWSKPLGLPCRRSRRQSHTHATRTGFPNAVQPPRLRAPPQPAPSLPISVSSVFSVVCFFRALRVLRGLFFYVFSVPSVLLARRFFSAREDFLCRNRSELPARPQPPRLFGCGYAALWFAFFSVSSVSFVVCFFRLLPTPSHNLPQIFFPFLFNQLPARSFLSSCSYLVC